MADLTVLVREARSAHRELDRCLEKVGEVLRPAFRGDVRIVRRCIDEEMDTLTAAVRAHRDYEQERASSGGEK